MIYLLIYYFYISITQIFSFADSGCPHWPRAGSCADNWNWFSARIKSKHQNSVKLSYITVRVSQNTTECAKAQQQSGHLYWKPGTVVQHSTSAHIRHIFKELFQFIRIILVVMDKSVYHCILVSTVIITLYSPI